MAPIYLGKRVVPSSLRYIENLALISVSTVSMVTVYSVCYADFALYTIMDLVRLVEPGVVSEHAALAAWMARVEQLPGVKQYLDTRPVCTGIGVAPKLQPKE